MTNEKHFSQDSHSEIELRRALLTGFLVCATGVFSFYGVKTGNIMFLLGVPFIPVAIYFLAHPSHLLVAAAWGTAAGLYVPGLSNMLNFSELMAVMITIVSLASFALGRERERTDSSASCLFFIVVLIVALMAVRGSGLRIFGGMTWGGKSYIRILIPVFMFFTAAWLRLSDSLVKKIIYGSVFFSLFRVFLQILVAKTGAFLWLSRYFSLDATGGFVSSVLNTQSAIMAEEAITRIGSWSVLSSAIFPFAFILIPRKVSRFVWVFGITGLSMIMAAFSGFRSSIMTLLATTFLYVMFCMKQDRKKILLWGAAAAMVGWICIVIFSPVLPTVVQRSFSWVPGIKVTEFVAQSASSSTDFRLEIWRMALQEISQYLILGKGLATDIQSMAWMQGYYYGTPEFFFKIHNYHSGPVALLLDFGLIGFFLVSAFFTRVCVENFRSWRQIRPDGFMALYHRLMTIQFLWQTISFYLIYGDLNDMFPSMIMRAALLMIIRRSCIDEQNKVA